MAVIETIQVTKTFHTGTVTVEAVRGIDLAIQPGEMVAIIGPSGSGKSSLLSLLGAIDVPTSGKVLVDGVDLTTLSDDERTLLRRRRIGFVFQAFNLMPTLSAIENIALPLELDGVSEEESMERSRERLTWVGLADRADHLPSMLSGGEQQRVAVARALVIEPALLLADEPTGNLDSASSRQIMRLLRDLVDSHGQTVVLVTHDLQVAGHADRILKVNDGLIEAEERPGAAHHSEAGEREDEIMLSSKLGWREIRKRPGRALLTLLSVVIGVAAVVAVTFTNQTTRKAFDQIYRSITGRAALEVSAPVGETIEESTLAKVQQTPGVLVASPIIQRRTVLYREGRRIQLLGMGVDPVRDRAVHEYKMEAGKGLGNSKDVMLHAAFAQSMGIKLNDRVELLTRVGRVKTRVIGLYSTAGTAMTGQGAVLLMPLRVAQEWFKAQRQVDQIQIVLSPDVDEAQVQADIAKRLPANATVHPPAARSRMAEETSLSTEQGLNMARAYSLLVATFIITNTFLISVTQRRRQFGILRAIGATKRQIAKFVVSQALGLGAAGTALGALLGVIAAHFLTRAMGSLYSTTLPPLELTWTPFLWAILFGIGISLAGAAVPARKAMNLSPLDAIRDVLPGEIEGMSKWLIWGGGGLILFCGSVLAASILGKIPMSNAVWGSVFLLVGVVLLLPLALKPLAEAVAALLPTSMRVETRLAARYLLAHRSRTTLTVGVVFVAISTGIGLANSVMDNVQDVRDWYHKTIVADFFVRATTPDMSTGLAADIPDEVDGEIREIPGIVSLDPIRLVASKAAGQQVVLIIRSFEDPKLQEFEVVEGDEKTVRQSLKQGDAVIGSVLAERSKLKAGDKISLTTDEGSKDFHIAAVVNDYQAGGLTMYLARDVAKEVLGIGGVDAYAVKADHDKLPEVREALDDLCQENGLLLQSFSDIQQTIDGMMSGVVAGLWGMVVLGLLVAAFGVANTLTMSVLEQTFELGLLRIVASTRGQVRTIVFAQAIMIGLLALVPGIIAGVSVGYLIHLATLPVIGHPVEFAVHPWLLAGGLAAGMAVVVIAAWGPAERAARIEVLEALRLR